MATALSNLAAEFNWLRLRLKGATNNIEDVARKAGVRIPDNHPIHMLAHLIDINLQREYKLRKATLLGIPEYKVQIRHRPGQKFRGLKRKETNES